MVFVPYCPKLSLKPFFKPEILINIQFWVPALNLSLIDQETKKLRKNLIFDGTSVKIREPKLEMTS